MMKHRHDAVMINEMNKRLKTSSNTRALLSATKNENETIIYVVPSDRLG